MKPKDTSSRMSDVGRLAWRINEWVALTGMSRPTVWRQARRGDLKLIRVGGIPMVPRTEAIRLGFISG